MNKCGNFRCDEYERVNERCPTSTHTYTVLHTPSRTHHWFSFDFCTDHQSKYIFVYCVEAKCLAWQMSLKLKPTCEGKETTIWLSTYKNKQRLMFDSLLIYNGKWKCHSWYVCILLYWTCVCTSAQNIDWPLHFCPLIGQFVMRMEELEDSKRIYENPLANWKELVEFRFFLSWPVYQYKIDIWLISLKFVPFP